MEIDDLVKSPWFSISGYIVGVLGVFATYYYYRKSIREKRPVFSVRPMSVFNNKRLKLYDIEVKYKGIIVDSLTITKFAFFNAGKDTIEQSHLVSKNPITIYDINGSPFYDVEILDSNVELNNLQIQWDKSKITINFDFLDFNQGVVLKIIHAGKGKELKMRDTIKGNRRIKSMDPSFTTLTREDSLYGAFYDDDPNFFMTDVFR